MMDDHGEDNEEDGHGVTLTLMVRSDMCWPSAWSIYQDIAKPNNLLKQIILV